MRVLVYGDFVTDRYIRVTSSRNCPEAPEAPVLDVVDVPVNSVGCAGNTLQNVYNIAASSLENIEIYFGGILDDGIQSTLSKVPNLFSSSNLVEYCRDGGITKDRLIDRKGRIICRVDSARTFKSSPPRITPSPEFDLVIISDYGFGSVDELVASKLISLGKLSVVDSKRDDLTIFRGATVFKLNHGEYARQVSRMANTEDRCVEALCRYCVVSKGDQGCEVKVFKGQGKEYRIDTIGIPAYPAEEVDVTGCGDTFTAAFALSLMLGRDVLDCARLANYLASRVVTRVGPDTPKKHELADAKEKGLL